MDDVSRRRCATIDVDRLLPVGLAEDDWEKDLRQQSSAEVALYRDNLNTCSGG